MNKEFRPIYMSEATYSSKNRKDRYIQKTPNKRKKCHCGCNGRRTHFGMAQGAVMMAGCEITVRRWVKYD